MQGIRRKIVYVTLYEAIAIAICTVGFALASGQDLGRASALSVACSVTAVLWNLVFNHLFERWEARQTVRGRSVARRVAHAIMFEGGLVVMLVPLIAWWLDVSLWHALVMDLGLLFFFLGYTFVFTWAFDRVFGLPATAAP
jgi:uncharacterized membrane protein